LFVCFNLLKSLGSYLLRLTQAKSLLHLSKKHVNMKISIIIPTYNRSSLLEETLDALCRQTAPHYLGEVIIINDGSTDLTDEVVDGFSDRLPIRYFRQARSGVSSARNRGLREASSSVVLLLDDDVVPSSQLIAEHVSFHTETPAVNAVLLGYVVWHPKVRVTPFMRWYGEYGALFGYAMLKENQPAPARFLYTCNVSFKTEFILAHGGFNETLTVLEDHELGYRLAKSGMKMIFRKSPLGYHNQAFTFEQACMRLQRYSTGLDAFLQTEAGKNKAQQRAGLLFRLAETGVKIIAPAVSPLRFMIDGDIKLPNSLYRLFYEYYGIYQSFWSRSSAK
jgi:glycosyltransferase involved in cell wall biosynthesis